ncbi:MAG: IS1096 element passenger TnpR family protein, partial [Planctomycetota bacterium]
MSLSQSQSDCIGASLVKPEVRKMARETSTGKCHLCGETVDKSAMTRHLKSCRQKEGSELASSGRRSRKKDVFHLLVEGRYCPEYWMHIELSADARLEALDNFLRDTWLECCGHLSMFSIQDKNYSVADMGEFDDETMDARLGDVLGPGMKFSHEYDFGSTTHLTLKVIAQEQKQIKAKDVKILARNDPPSFA